MIEFQNLSKNYKVKKGQNVEPLKNDSYKFAEKGMVFIIGKSGRGKSIMLNVLGLLDTYDYGEFLIGGKCSKTFSKVERDVFRAINMVLFFRNFT